MSDLKTRKAKRKQKELYDGISPENRMRPEDMEGINKDNVQPVMKMDPGNEMPVFMFIADVGMEFPPLGLAKMNFMMCAQHMIKTNRIEVRGRMRFEDTGRKTHIEMKHDFKFSDLEKAKQEIRDMYAKMTTEMGLVEDHKPWEMTFEVNEDMDSVMKKLNDSGHFNIGIIPVK